MKRKFLETKKTLFGLCFVLAVLVLNGLNAEPIQAAGGSFVTDSYTIALGDEVYLPYLFNSSDGIKFSALELPSNEYYDGNIVDEYSVNGSSTTNFLVGARTGSVPIWARSGNKLCDTMTLYVTSRSSFPLSGTTSVGMQVGQVCRSFIVEPSETNTYRFSVSGTTYYEVWVYNQDYDNVIGYAVGNRNNTNLEVYLEGDESYYLEFYTYNTSSSTLSAPNREVTLNVSVTENAKADSVALQVIAYAFKAENDTYYMLEGDTFDIKVAQGGVPNFQKVNYQISTTNPGMVSLGYTAAEDTYQVKCNAPGIVDISVTTSNMLTDSFKLVVWGKDQLVTGDVDMDGFITRSDIEKMYSVITGQSEKTRIYYHADMNGDAQLNESDIQIMLEMVGGLPFVDVVSDDWFYNDVEFNYNENIMTGMDLIHFSPYAPLARAQFASILYRLNESPDVEFTAEFFDIEEGIWYTAPILWAKAEGIVNGYADGRFGPGDMITREQMAVMMYNYAVSKGYDTSASEDLDAFKDAETVSEFALEEMRWAVGAGIISGKANGTELDPQGQTSRAECAVICKQFIQKIANN